MSSNPAIQQALSQAIAEVPSSTPLASTGKTSTPKAAIRRCCAAWQRSFDAYMQKAGTRSCADVFAADSAAKAYRDAMPMLDGYDGVRDFIACTAHGILIGSIPESKAGQLLYAAQVALAAIPRELKTAKSTLLPTPGPLKNTALEDSVPIQLT